MKKEDYNIVESFKQKLLKKHIPFREIIVFGSRARGTDGPDSDLDILIIVDEKNSDICENINDCAWEIGFEEDIFIQTIIMTHQQARVGPEKSSLLMLAVNQEGIRV